MADIPLPERAGALEAATGGVAHAASMGRFVRKRGDTYKKSLGATERLRARVKRLRKGWFRHRMPAMRAQPYRSDLRQNPSDTPAWPLSAWQTTGKECAVRRMGNADLHRSLIPQQLDCTLGSQGRSEWGRFCRVYSRCDDPRTGAWQRCHLRSPCDPQKHRGRRRAEGAQMLDPLSADVLTRPHSNSNGLLQTQGTLTQKQDPDIQSDVRRPR